MTKRHDSSPLTRRELRERERDRLAALASTDPSWRAPEDDADESQVEPLATPVDGAQDAPVDPSSQTDQAPEPDHRSAKPSPFAPPAESTDAPVQPQSGGEAGQHLTRRQLRELRAAEAAERQAALSSDASEPSGEPAVNRADEPEVDESAAEAEQGETGHDERERAETGPVEAEPAEAGLGIFALAEPESPATELMSQPSAAFEPETFEPEPFEPAMAEPETVVYFPDWQQPADVPPPHSSKPDTADQDDDDAEPSSKRTFHPPTGHWSIAAGQKEQPSFEEIIAGPPDTSGYGAIGSTLVLPTVPSAGPAWGAMGKSGEALETGSVDLPASLSSTGEHARFDTSALDRMLDEEEVRVDTAMVHAPGSEPVRASSAVSSLTPTDDVVGKSATTGHRLPMALAISAGALALGVVGLFAAGAILGLF